MATHKHHRQVQEQVQEKVQVWIYLRDPKKDSLSFLILKTNPKRGSFWQPVTGGVEAGETLDAAASREAYEETGLQFQGSPELIEGTIEFESRHKDAHGKALRVVEHAFSLSAKPTNESFPSVQLDPHEHTEFQWVSAEMALELIHFPSNIQVLKSLLARLECTER